MATTFLTALKLSQIPLQQVAIESGGSLPGSPVAGQLFFYTGSNTLQYYTGSAWVVISASGTGTVTTASVVSANGFAGTVATATTTPAITLTTSITGVLKGNGTAISAATSGTDYAPATSGSSVLKASSGGFANATASDVLGLGSIAPLASPTFTGTVTVPTTVNSTDAAQKQYVDNAVQGLGSKTSARFATAGGESYTVVSGAVTVIAGTTLDGGSPAVGDMILVKNAPAATGAGPGTNSTQPGNGLYTVSNATTNLTLARVTTGDTSLGANPAGAYVFVEAGTANAGAGFVVTTPSSSAGFTYGSGNIAFVQFSGAGELTASSPLSLSGNVLSLGTVGFANGGTGQTSQQAAINALVGTGYNTSGDFLRSNGTNAVMSALTAADIPTNPNVAPGALATNSQKIAAIYSTGLTLGNGSLTTITVTHNLNNSYPNVEVFNSTGAVVCDVIVDTANAIQLGFATAPATNTIACTVIG